MNYQPKDDKLCENIARAAHEGQFRRNGSTPYIRHVEATVRNLPAVKDTNHANMLRDVAWLHDVLEDTHVTVADLLNAGVSDQVIGRVLLLTKKENDVYTEYLERVGTDFYASTVKIADMRSNMADSPTEKQRAKYNEALPYLTERVLQHATQMLRNGFALN